MSGMKNLLVLDFESLDKYISLKLGQGWAYPKNETLFKVLGFSLGSLDEKEEVIYVPLTEDNKRIALEGLYESLLESNGVICHGAQYELGCLHYFGFDISKLKVYDTEIIAKLHDNTLLKYDLESLSKKYLSEKFHKKKNILVNSAVYLNLADHLMSEEAQQYLREEGELVLDQKEIKRIEKYCYENMELLQQKDPQSVAEYCNQDIVSTRELFKFLVNYEEIKV